KLHYSKNRKKRKYDEDYLKYGFIPSDNDPSLPFCMICRRTLSNEAMLPSKLHRHIEAKHREQMGNPISYFESLTEMKSKKPTKVNEKALRAKKPHTIAETLIMPAAIDMCREMFGKALASKLKTIPISNDTIQRRITLAAADVEEQLISRLQDCKQFAIQLDESTDVSGQAQLIAYVRYIWMDEVEEDFLFCKVCPGHTTSAELFAILDNFMAANSIEWSWCIGVCTDGAAAMTGKRTGLWERVRSNVPTATFTHCMIHRESLTSKRMNANLKSIFDQAIKIVNYIKAHPLNSRLFASLCSNMDFDHEQLLMHTEVRWLSRGKVFNRLFELRDAVREFLGGKISQPVVHLNDNSWVAALAYLADIFEQLNKLNSSLQGKHTNLITLSDKVSAFMKKLDLWKTRLFQENAEINKPELVKLISEHIQSLLDQFNFYFGDLNVESFSWVSSPFLAHIDSLNLPTSELNQLIELTSDTTLKMMHPRVSLMKFWTQASHEYPELSQKAFKIILSFATSYLCECGFSALVTIKTKCRSRLEVEDELRLSLSSITPRLDKLCSNLQAQGSH
uniref:HAT C-terminal dimerisation domain-containing protein n=1 Tax=Erpetoichthys calabaricus TaxID=27687 RepID=A0A8C4TH09_ERPCA